MRVRKQEHDRGEAQRGSRGRKKHERTDRDCKEGGWGRGGVDQYGARILWGGTLRAVGML